MSHDLHSKHFSRLTLARSFLAIFVPLAALLAIVAGVHYYAYQEAERMKLEASETLDVGLARRMIATDIDGVVTDLMFLARRLEQERFTRQTAATRTRHLGQLFRLFAQQKGLYDQIRYLNRKGMEVVRVNFSSGTPMIVPRRNLQDKSQRYYFQEAIKLGEGEVYISPLDLNVENGIIEQPFKPMMRFATPVFDPHGNKVGVVVLNYFGERLIGNFLRAAANIADRIHLLDRDGYWLSSPSKQDEWGFMFGSQHTFRLRHPHVWKQMAAARSGQLYTAAGLFTFTTVSPVSAARSAAGGAPDYHWKIVSHVSPRILSATPGLFIRRHSPLYAAMLLLLAVVSLLLTRARCHHRRAEAQREYERRFRHTLENIELAAVTVNRDGNAVFCNDYFLKLTGWSRQDVMGKDWIGRFIPASHRDRTRALLGRLDRPEHIPNHYETEVLTRQGARRLIAWNNTLSFGANGKVIGITGIGEDITEQRRNQEQVRKLSRAVEQSPSMVLITNRQGQIQYVNPKFTEVTGYTLREVAGKNPRLLKSGETTPGEYEDLWATITAGREWRGEFHNRRKNGELYWESASISALRNSDGEITSFLAVKEDITDRRRLEQEVEERNRELAKTQTLTAMGRMASMVAHDLRNPLSSVKMALQILAKKGAAEHGEEARELHQIALEQVGYMEEILSDMLTYARPEAINQEWINVDKLLGAAIGTTRKKVDEYGVTVSTYCQPGLPAVPGDTSKLRQVFSNLIVNAAQATAENPEGEREVSVGARLNLGADGTDIRIEVCDNGCGINPTERDKLFEPFYTSRAKGTGLGLAIVKKILDQHLGSIRLEARQQRGTRAVVILPTTPAEPGDRNAA